MKLSYEGEYLASNARYKRKM